ncbi:YoqW [Paenibacillus mucilaginosus 3016]|uniref:Abasic site processing protein n=1 Tax=Paenibacillus mucilaginosus 3016 TaxID=1116391 RepID=H6NBC3_9BACL|nr:SOS response-associated peptidase [Paenibacillus mucilaginosus]AFC32869.1 YoqW [Paenibacillus mucilaginosus 3016]WFA21323.1 SOS response-associated peptidase [Paenibacillus mucilaginosus]
MCGRFTLTAPESAIIEHFDLSEPLEDYKPRYNVAPGQQLLAVVNDGQQYKIKRFKWGLVPFWAKDPKMGYSTFNARAETVATKAAFREPLKRSRTLIVADGFFEWLSLSKKEKQPMRFLLKSKEVYGFAGLWDTWRGPDGTVLETCTIITTTPNDVVKDVHDRMPVILPRENEQAWLDPGTQDTEFLHSLLQPYPAEEMFSYPVSSLVGNVRNDSADLIEELNSK